MFREALRNIVENTDGGVAGLIMDSEGISVDVYARDGAPFDITTIGIEFGVVLGSIRRAAESLEAGQPRPTRWSPSSERWGTTTFSLWPCAPKATSAKADI